PFINNRYLCDLFGLVDLDTENVLVQEQLQNYLKVLFERGVTMLRIDAAMHVYPESLIAIVSGVPFDYIVQEYYPEASFAKSLPKAGMVGHFTNFQFGDSVGQVLFDDWLDSGEWQDSTKRFGDLLHIGFPSPDCEYSLCQMIYPPELALLFLDNHDQQRERWKTEKGGPPDSPMCRGNLRKVDIAGLSTSMDSPTTSLNSLCWLGPMETECVSCHHMPLTSFTRAHRV
ncbi:unnamed protein product, partial [Cladocopium goreaui]